MVPGDKGLRALQARPVLKALQVFKVHVAHKALWGPLVPRAQFRGRKVPQDRKAYLVYRALRACKVRLEPLRRMYPYPDRQGPQVRRDQRDAQDLWDYKVHKEFLDQPAHKALQVFKVRAEFQDYKVIPEGRFFGVESTVPVRSTTSATVSDTTARPTSAPQTQPQPTHNPASEHPGT